MFHRNAALLFPLAVIEAASCGSFSFGGPSEVQHVAEAWNEEYSQHDDIVMNKECPENDGTRIVTMTTRNALETLCSQEQDFELDIAGTLSPLDEGVGWLGNCNEGNEQNDASIRSFIQVDVASQGIAVLTNTGGAAADCIRRLGGGLTLDQLRWIFSSYSYEQLQSSGWDDSTVVEQEVSSNSKLRNTDFDPTRRYWSQLDERCETQEIEIAGYDEDSAAHDYFAKTIFQGDETFRSQYKSSADLEGLMKDLKSSENGLAFVFLSSVLSPPSTANHLDQGLYDVASVAIQNAKGKFVGPATAVHDDDSYPLSQRLYMNILNEDHSLTKARPFLEFGYSQEGNDALVQAGFLPIHDWEKIVMKTRAQTATGIKVSSDEAIDCGPGNGVIEIAGSSTVFPVARIWAQIYNVLCSNVQITVHGGGSSDGAGRVCANEEHGRPVQIADMSRDWKSSEAEEHMEFLYACKKGDPNRSAIQLDVALDGMTIATQVGGVADGCIQTIGGLTMDQLRWIYTSYDDIKLEKTGWDPNSLKNSDRDSKTHLWNELDPRCPRMEIRIAGADPDSGTFEYFKQVVLTDHENGESFDTNRPIFGYRNSHDDEELVTYVKAFPEAISYFGYAYYFEHTASLSAVSIENDEGDFVAPTRETITSGTYTPLTRPIHMNLLNDPDALAHTVPFVKFGLMQHDLVSSTGFVPISESSRVDMLERMDGAPWEVSSSASSGRSFGRTTSLLTGLPLMMFLFFI